MGTEVVTGLGEIVEVSGAFEAESIALSTLHKSPGTVYFAHSLTVLTYKSCSPVQQQIVAL